MITPLSQRFFRTKSLKDQQASMFTCVNKPIGKESKKMYIEKQLTRANMHLFMEARKSRSMGAKFVWMRNSYVLMGRKEKKKIVRKRDFAKLSGILKG